jgi:hypothetical protein
VVVVGQLPSVHNIPAVVANFGLALLLEMCCCCGSQWFAAVAGCNMMGMHEGLK